MGISLFNIKKWFRMLSHKSILHVNQNVGQIYSKTEIAGYYNDLTEKVSKSDENTMIPLTEYPDNQKREFSIAIIQFGLGAYDLYLKSKEQKYKDKFLACVEWAEEHFQDNGSIKTFEYEFSNAPYSAMAQGEVASLLLRAYALTSDEKYLAMAKSAIDFMLLDISNGGTSKYKDNDIYLYEFTIKPYVFNGWIFSIFGLYDYVLVSNDEHYRELLNRTITTLAKEMPKMDNGYWSMYDVDKKIASPFYHSLHIAQLKVMYDITGKEEFLTTANKFEKYEGKWWNRQRAFWKKVMQKIFER